MITYHHIKRLRTYKPNVKREEAGNTSSSPIHPAATPDPNAATVAAAADATAADAVADDVATDDGAATLSDDSQDLSDAEFYKHIDEIVETFLELKKLHRNDDIPKSTQRADAKLKKWYHDDDIPTFQLLTPDSSQDMDAARISPQASKGSKLCINLYIV